SLQKLSRRLLSQELLEVLSRNIDCEGHLSNVLRSTLRWEDADIPKPALKDVERMQYACLRAVGEPDVASALHDLLRIEPHDGAQEVDLLDSLTFNSLTQLCSVRRSVVYAWLPVAPTLMSKGYC